MSSNRSDQVVDVGLEAQATAMEAIRSIDVITKVDIVVATHDVSSCKYLRRLIMNLGNLV
jgi:hypothetical protein